MIYYYAIIVISIILAMRAEKHKINLFLCIVLVSLISGLRDYSVGTDTARYARAFQHYIYSDQSLMEVGFVYTSRLILSLLPEPRWVFIIYSFFINTLIICRLWSIRDRASFGFMFFLYVTIFFPQSMNILRQYIALAVVFFSSIWIEKRRPILFFLGVIIASSFHTSAIIGVLLFFINLIVTTKGNRIQLIIVTAFIGVSMYILTRMLYNYSGYDFNNNISISLLYISRILAIVVFWVEYKIKLKKQILNTYILDDYNITIYYTIGVILSTIGLFADQVGRISLYFMIFEIPFVATYAYIDTYRVKVFKDNTESMYSIAYTILALYFLIYKTGILGESGIAPYKMFFMQ